MINEIKVNGQKIIKEEKTKNGILFTLENGEIIKKISLNKKKIEIKCNECNNFIKRKTFFHAFVTKYRCRKCFLKTISGEKNYFYGKKRSKEFKEKLSRERKGKRLNPHSKSVYQYWIEKYGKEKADILFIEYKEKHRKSSMGEKNGFYGKKHTKETIYRISKSNEITRKNRSEEKKKEISLKISKSQKKLQLENPEEYKRLKSKAGKISNLKKEKYKINKLEKRVKNELENRKLNFEYSVIICFKQFDFGNKEFRILLEVQGDYWHANPLIYKNENLTFTQKKNIEKDKEKVKFAQDYNFKLFHIWENDIKNNNFDVIDQIERYINDKINSNC